MHQSQTPKPNNNHNDNNNSFGKNVLWAKLANASSPRADLFEQASPQPPKPNNNHNDNNNSFGKKCLGQSLPMPAPRGQAFSSKLRPAFNMSSSGWQL